MRDGLGTLDTVSKNQIQNQLGPAISFHKNLPAMETSATMSSVVESCDPIFLSGVYGT